MTKKAKPEYGSARGMIEVRDLEATPTEMGFDLPDLAEVATADLRAELARGLSLTAQTLMRLGMIWAELERRGEDLSDLKYGLARTLPLIASGRLAAEAVLAFANRPALLRALEGVPLVEQRAFAAGKNVAVIDPADPQAIQEMPLERLPAAAVRLVFSEGEVRPPQAQRLALRPRRRASSAEATRRYQPRYDAATGQIQVGRMQIALADLLGELARAVGPDRPPAFDRPDDYLTVKTRLSHEEHERFQALCRRHELPDWEMIRKALRAFGLLGQ